MNLRFFIGVFFLSLLGAAAFGWLSHYEYVQSEVDLGFNKAAYVNPFLAAGRLLRAEGFELIKEGVFSSVDELLGGDAVILAYEQQHMGRQEARRLLEWVAQGGYLILGVHSIHRGHLAKGLGFSKAQRLSGSVCKKPEKKSKKEKKPKKGANKATLSEQMREENAAYLSAWRERQEHIAPPKKAQTKVDRSWQQHVGSWEADYLNSLEDGLPLVTAFDLAQSGTTSFVNFDTNFSVVQAPIEQLVEEEPILLQVDGTLLQNTRLSFALGRGRVDVLVHTNIWRNDRIGLLDHAHVLKDMLSALNAQKVSFVGALRSPSIFEHLRVWAPEFVLSLMLLLLVWLMARGFRIGPIYPSIVPVHRSVIAHLSACGIFLWHNNGRSTMICDLLRPLVAKASSRLGSPLMVGEPSDWVKFESLVSVLAPQLKPHMAMRYIKQAFFSKLDEELAEHAFIDTVKFLQQLGKVI